MSDSAFEPGWLVRLGKHVVNAVMSTEDQKLFDPRLDELYAANAWPRFLVQKKTEFLNYDPDYLRSWYSKEACLPGGQPYSEIVNLLRLKAKPTIEVVANPAEFVLSNWGNAGDEIVRLALNKKMGIGAITRPDTRVIRLTDITVEDGFVRLYVQPTRYIEQVKSNLIVDFQMSPGPGSNLSLRSLLGLDYKGVLPPLSESRLANTIGVSTVLFYKDSGFWTPALWPRADKKNVTVFEGGWHCSSSGAAEWGPAKTFESLIMDDMVREIEEELGVTTSRLVSLVPVAICREFARAGKPQIFFAGIVDMNHDELMQSIEKAHRAAEKQNLKKESLEHPIFSYPRLIIKRMRKIQADNSNEKHIARQFGVDDLFGRRGLTTECVANLYYASLALPSLLASARAG